VVPVSFQRPTMGEVMSSAEHGQPSARKARLVSGIRVLHMALSLGTIEVMSQHVIGSDKAGSQATC